LAGPGRLGWFLRFVELHMVIIITLKCIVK
jgi:hypothetical protein